MKNFIRSLINLVFSRRILIVNGRDLTDILTVLREDLGFYTTQIRVEQSSICSKHWRIALNRCPKKLWKKTVRTLKVIRVFSERDIPENIRSYYVYTWN